MRGSRRGEMVVLLRAFTHVDAYEEALERAGLAPYVVGGRGYWSAQQVEDVLRLLRAIANPLDDEALFGALASPACGASADALWLLREAAGPSAFIWPVLRASVRGEGERGCGLRAGRGRIEARLCAAFYAHAGRAARGGAARCRSTR